MVSLAKDRITHVNKTKDNPTPLEASETANPGAAGDLSMLELLLQTTSDGILDWDLVSGRVVYTPRFHALLGYDEGAVDESPALWRSLSHPDDLPHVEALLTDHLESFWPFDHTWRMRHYNGSWRWIMCRASTARDSGGRPYRLLALFSDITERVWAQERLGALIAAVPDAILRVHAEGQVLDRKLPTDAMAADIPWPAIGDLLQQWSAAAPWQARVLEALQAPGGFHGRLTFDSELQGTQGCRQIEISMVPGGGSEAVCLIRDVTAARQLQVEVMQTHKLESIGQLAAGIAHEINTPTQYIGDNLTFARGAFDDCLTLLAAYGTAFEEARSQPLSEATVVELERVAEECDIEYLQQTLPKALDSALEGTGRVAQIVRAMKEFSHPRKLEKTLCDLHKEIENTITISSNVWKYVADLERDFDPDLPQVECHAGEINQVVLNLIVNASHTIADALRIRGEEKGTLRISTRHVDEWAEIRVSDTGMGIPTAIRHRIFDPFFTTKEVGRGTGQGLSIARSAIRDKHQGNIEFETEEGKGTTFIIRLPCSGASPTP